MDRAATIGFDIAKSVFQAHGVDQSGVVVSCGRFDECSYLAAEDGAMAGYDARYDGLLRLRH